MHRLLIIDPEKNWCCLIMDYLEQQGFQVEKVDNGRAGVNRALSHQYSLVLLATALPDGSGLEVLHRLRSESSAAVVMIGTNDEQINRILSLEVGADDYVSKPVEPRELVARIRAVLRRCYPFSRDPHTVSPATTRIADVTLNRATWKAYRGEELLRLTTIEFNLLDLFLVSAGRVVRRETLIEKVLGRSFNPFDRSIDMHVSNLRKKLGSARDGAERIKTIRGVGYVYARPEKD